MFICSVRSESKQFFKNKPQPTYKKSVYFKIFEMEHVSIKKVNYPVGLNWWWGGGRVPYSRTCGKSNTILKSQLSAVMTSSSQVLILVYTNIHSKYLFLFTFDWIGEVSIFNTLSYIVWEQLTSD